MDIQMKRGLLDACVLCALLKEDSYGYKIIKDLSGMIDISESTLYPILRRLESGGQLSVYSKEHNGRLRKYYAITEAGRSRLKEFVEDWKTVCEVYEYIKGETENNEQA